MWYWRLNDFPVNIEHLTREGRGRVPGWHVWNNPLCSFHLLPEERKQKHNVNPHVRMSLQKRSEMLRGFLDKCQMCSPPAGMFPWPLWGRGKDYNCVCRGRHTFWKSKFEHMLVTYSSTWQKQNPGHLSGVCFLIYTFFFLQEAKYENVRIYIQRIWW